MERAHAGHFVYVVAHTINIPYTYAQERLPAIFISPNLQISTEFDAIQRFFERDYRPVLDFETH